MKTSTKRILSIGLAGLLFVGILVVYTSFIRPAVKEITDKRAVLLSKETLFNNQKSAVNQVQNLIGQFQNIAKFEETVSLALPKEENVTGVLNQIQSIANLSKAELDSFSLKPLAFEVSRQPLVKRLGSLEISLSASGPYENVKKFLRSLETNVRIINVKNFKFVPVGSPLDDNYKISLTVETFYQE